MPTSRPVRTSRKLEDILDYYEDVGKLAEEMATWRSKVPSSLYNSPKYDQVNTAAGILDDGARGLETFGDNVKPILESVPGALDKEITFIIHLMYKGYQKPRWVRLANPIAAYKAAVLLIRDNMESWLLDEDKLEELRGYLSYVDDVISDLQQVEFPTMYG